VELQYYGANCVRISGKKFSVVVDDNLQSLGLKSVTKPTDISLRTNLTLPEHKDVLFAAEMPGEYEISGAIIHGVAAEPHMGKGDKKSSVIYTIEAEDVRVAITGHIQADLSEDQLEQIGLVDVLIVPVGNHGYTLDPVGALSVIKKIEPKVVIPTHYADKAIKYEVPQVELAEAIKGLAMEPAETTAKYKAKAAELADSTKLIILERQ